ncbi:MAG TPA: TonB-dependent receptor [Phenylobacterium sp.]|nr:TonB-dependent receptor [Phenylobacterium sp.]
MTLGTLAIASPAVAQVAAPAPPAAAAEPESYGVAEVIVTAQRRSESGQSVPISVAAFSSEQIEKVGLASTADLASIIPGLTINPTAARSPIFLRGVGNNGTSTSPSVLMFIDGVYQPFDNSGADFSNVQSIEVAKGPQGTLFGRNATGGVIQVTTKNPLDWQGVDAQVGYGNYDTLSGKIYAAAKLSEKAAVDIAGFYDNQADGWGTNVATGDDIYKAKRYGVRSKAVVELDDTFTATLTADYAYRRGSLGLGISTTVPDGFLFNPITQTAFTLPTPYDINSEISPFYRTREAGGALTLEKHVGEVKLLSISSYRTDKESISIDFDGTELPLIHLTRHDKRWAFTQEFQASGGGETFNWVAGLYYFRSDDKINGPNFAGLFFPGGFGMASKDRDEAYAGYAQGTAEILPDTRLTLGARYTIEKRELTGRTATASGFIIPGSEGTEKATFKKPNFRVALDHKFSSDVLGYVSWTRGFNAGFFNQISFGGFTEAANPVVKPEEIDAYEAGVKSEFLDHRLRVNAAAFLYDYSNLQQQLYSPGGIIVVNAASARIKGVDLDVTFRPVRNLILSVGGNYLDTEYRSYPSAPDYNFLPSGEFVVIGPRNAKGKRLVAAPKFGLQASGTYTLETSVGTFDTTVNVNYQTKQYSDPQNEYAIRSRTLVGLTEQWKSTDEKTTVTAWVKNLTDEEYDVSYSLLTTTGLVANPGAPRTYGVTIGRKF